MHANFSNIPLFNLVVIVVAVVVVAVLVVAKYTVQVHRDSIDTPVLTPHVECQDKHKYLSTSHSICPVLVVSVVVAVVA